MPIGRNKNGLVGGVMFAVTLKPVSFVVHKLMGNRNWSIMATHITNYRRLTVEAVVA